MNKQNFLEFPAFIYQQDQTFIADCSTLNFTAVGSSEIEAINNLECSIKQKIHFSDVFVKPIYERR